MPPGRRLLWQIYVRDSGLVHALLGLRTLDDVLGHPVVGGSWEGFVIENLLAAAPVGTEAYFYRTSAGAEIDLLPEISARRRRAIEIKRSSAPSVSKGFHLGCEDIGATRRSVVRAGRETFGLGKDIEAMTLSDAVEALSKKK